jgi:hypothetical protein
MRPASTVARPSHALRNEGDNMGYDDSTRQRLLHEFLNLRTFQDVARWDAEARAEAQRIETIGTAAEAELAAKRQARQAATEEFARRSFFARLFGSKQHIRALEAQEKDLARSIAMLEDWVEDLLERVDLTPDNPKEQKALLKELRAEKKELALAKKEARAEMASIRTAARQATADVGPGFGKFTRSLAADQRRSIRRNKEAMLGPRESAVAAIDRQLLALERRMAWVERFGARDDDEDGAPSKRLSMSVSK